MGHVYLFAIMEKLFVPALIASSVLTVPILILLYLWINTLKCATLEQQRCEDLRCSLRSLVDGIKNFSTEGSQLTQDLVPLAKAHLRTPVRRAMTLLET